MHHKLTLVAALAVCAPGVDAAEPIAPVWTVTQCVGAPSHALYDAATETLYVSQISGEGDKRDGVGLISRLDLEGNLRECEWVSGLDAPKGLPGSPISHHRVC